MRRSPKVSEVLSLLYLHADSQAGTSKKAIKEITEAENKAEAHKAVKEFKQEFGITSGILWVE